MTIHKEGCKSIMAASVLVVVINVLQLIFLKHTLITYLILAVSVLFVGLVVQFFRSPKRKGNDNNHQTIISPADGKIVAIETVYEKEFLKQECKQISIFMSPLNVHLNRYPISGKVAYMKYHPGAYLVAWHPKSSEKNERTTVAIAHDNGHNILLRQIAGTVARRIVCYAQKNTSVEKGAELGFIKFGSRVDIFIPLDCRINIQLQQKVKGGETVIASF